MVVATVVVVVVIIVVFVLSPPLPPPPPPAVIVVLLPNAVALPVVPSDFLGGVHHGVGGTRRYLKQHGWSAENIGFGSGGGLLQKLNRDTQKFAFKCW